MQEELGKKIKVSLSWAFLNQFIMQFLLIAFNIYLARLLDPRDFGIAGMVTVFSGFALFFVDAGFGTVLVQKQNVTQSHLSTVFWTNLVIGTFLYGLFYLLAAPLSQFYNEPVLENITKVTGLIFIISALSIVQNSLLVKDMNFKRKSLLNWAATGGGYLVSIILAYEGYGVWAIVMLNLVVALLNTVLLWLTTKWFPSPVFSRYHFKEMFSFGINVLGETSINYWSRNADNFLIGKYVGSEGLGLYSRAYTIMLLPLRNISGVISKVMFPAFSNIQNDLTKIRSIYLKTIRYISFITFPAMFGLSVLADEFVIIFFGNQWMGMVPIIRWLAVLGAFQSIIFLNGMIYNSLGKVNLAFRISILVNAVLLVSFIIGIWLDGVMGVTIAYFFAGFVLSLPIYARAIREIQLPLYQALGVLSKAFFSSLAMVFILLIFAFFKEDKSSVFTFALSIVLGFVVYVSCLYAIDGEFRKIIKTRKI